jgi:hypothetical protein
MGTTDDDIVWLQTQLTVARWHLDASLAGSIELARRNIERARQAYDGALEALRDLQLTAELHQALSSELASIRDRLQAAGVEV